MLSGGFRENLAGCSDDTWIAIASVAQADLPRFLRLDVPACHKSGFWSLQKGQGNLNIHLSENKQAV